MDHSSNIDPTPSVKMSSVSTAHTGTAPPGLRLDTQLLYTLHCTGCTVCTVQCRRHRLGLGCDKDRARHLSAVCCLCVHYNIIHYTVWSVLCYVSWHLDTTNNGQLSLHSVLCGLLFVMGWYASCMVPAGLKLGWDETVHNNRVKVSDDDFWLVLACRGAEAMWGKRISLNTTEIYNCVV